MDFKKYMKTWDGMQLLMKWERMVIITLSLLLLLFAAMWASRSEKIILEPYTLSQQAWVTEKEASRSYKEAWGLFLAQLMGNTTPQTVDFVKKRLGPLLAPSIYQQVMEAMDQQALQIKEDRVTIRFEPRFVSYEPDTDKVFVYGYSYERGPTGAERRRERTYEYSIKISNYAPIITNIQTYTGKPRTKKVLEQMESKRKRGDK